VDGDQFRSEILQDGVHRGRSLPAGHEVEKAEIVPGTPAAEIGGEIHKPVGGITLVNKALGRHDTGLDKEDAHGLSLLAEHKHVAGREIEFDHDGAEGLEAGEDAAVERGGIPAVKKFRHEERGLVSDHGESGLGEKKGEGVEGVLVEVLWGGLGMGVHELEGLEEAGIEEAEEESHG
jgi:hypothetical protein